MKLLGLAMLGVACAVTQAPVATATTQSFLYTVRSMGITGSDWVLVDWGVRVCTDLGSGYDPVRVAQNVWLHTAILEPESAGAFVAASIVHLCPEFFPRQKTQVA